MLAAAGFWEVRWGVGVTQPEDVMRCFVTAQDLFHPSADIPVAWSLCSLGIDLQKCAHYFSKAIVLDADYADVADTLVPE